MLSLNHYVVGDSLRKSDFLELCMDSENMDKDDFLESVYYIDEDFKDSKSKGASLSGKGKEPVEGHPVGVPEDRAGGMRFLLMMTMNREKSPGKTLLLRHSVWLRELMSNPR